MANKELMVTLGLDASSYSQNVKRAKDLNKELDSSWKLLTSSSEKFEKSVQGLGKKQDYLSDKIKVANGLSEVYAKRLAESQEALEDAKQKSQQYGSEVERLNTLKESILKNLGSESKMYQAVSEKIKANTQLYDKANKAIEVNNKRILEAKTGYNETQASLQALGKEVTFTAEKMSAMRADANIDALKNDISELDHKFDLVKNSVSNFDSTMDGLQKTQDFYNEKTKLSKELLEDYSSEIKNSSQKIQSYEKDLRDVNEELETWQQLLDSYDMLENAEEYEEARMQVQSLRQEYSQINQILEFHQNRLENLTSEYKTTETNIAKLEGSLDATGKKMKTLSESITFEKVSNEVKELSNGAIKKLESEMEKLDNEFELLTTSAKEFESTLSGLELKQDYFNKSLKLAQQNFNEYSKELTEVKNKTKELTDEQKKLENEIEERIAKLQKLSGAEWDKEAEAIKKLKKQYEEVNKDLNTHSSRLKDVEKGYTSSKLKIAQLNRELDDTGVQMTAISKKKIFDNLDNQIKSVTSEIKILESKFKATESSMKNFAKTKKGLEETTETYKTKLILLNKQLEITNKTLDKNGEHLSQLKTEQDLVAKSIDALKTKMANMDKESPDYKEALASLSRLENSYNEINREIDEFQAENNRLQVELNETTAEINTLARQTNNLSREFYSTRFRDFGQTMTNIGSGIQQVGQSLLGLSVALGAVQTATVTTGVNFTNSMAKVQAVTGATSEEFKYMSDKAREFAKVTVYSASEAGDALQYLGLAGYSASQAVDALPSILSLAQAGALELSVASDKATDSLSSLGYVQEEAVAMLPEYLDKIAMASTRSNTSIEQMMDAYIKVGGQLDTMNISLDTSATMLGVLANRGMKAELAGNSLNSILINLTQRSGQSAEALAELGVSAFDTEGNIKDIEVVIQELAVALSTLSEQDQIQLINMIGGKTQAKTLQKLLQGMVTDTGELTEEYTKLKAEIEKAPDMNALENMAETMSDNLGGDISRLTSQIEESFLVIFDEIEPKLREFVQKLTESIEKLTTWFAGLKDNTQMAIIAFAGILTILPPFLMAIGTMTMGIGAISSGIGGLIKILPSFKDSVDESGEIIEGLGTKMKKLSKEIPKMVKNIKNYGTSVGSFFSGLSASMGTWFATISATTGTFFSGLIGSIGTWLSGIGTAIASSSIWGTITGALSTLGGWIATGLGAVFSTAGLEIIAICVAVAGAIYLIYKGIKYLWENWDAICDNMKEAWKSSMDWIGDKIDWFKEKASQFSDSFKNLMKNIKEKIKDGTKAVGEFFKELPSKILEFIKKIPSMISKVFDTVLNLLAVFVGNFIGGVITLGKEIYDIISGVIETVKGIIDIVVGIFTLNFDKIKEGVSKVFSGIVGIISDTIHNVWVLISRSLENIAKVFGVNLSGVTEAIETWCSETWNVFTTWCSDIWNGFITWCSNMWESFVKWCDDTLNKCIEWLSELKTKFVCWATETWNKFINWLTGLYNSFVNWCSDMKQKLINWLSEFVKDPIRFMKEFAINIANGCVEAYNKFVAWCDDMLTKLRTWFSELISNTWTKIVEWANKFSEGVQLILNFFKELPSKLWNIGAEMIDNLWEGFKSKLNSFGTWVKDSVSNIVGGLFRSVPSNIETEVNYTQGEMPTLAKTAPADFYTVTSRSGFSGISDMMGNMLKEAFSLDNFKTNGGFYKPDSMKITKTETASSNANDAIIEALVQQNQLLMQLLTTSRPIEVGVNVDGRQIAKASARYMDTEINLINKRKTRLGGAF